MCAAFSEVGQNIQTGRSVVDVYDLTKYTWKLFNGHLVTIWVEQNQVFWHEDAYYVVPPPVVDWDTAVPLSVYLLCDLTIDDRINI